MSGLKIACLIPGGIGGTQKAGWLFAEGLARLGHQVVGYSAVGPLVPAHPVQGLAVEIIAGESDSFPAIAEGRFDALHVHMPGYYIRHPIYPFLKSLGRRRPRVVETNIFGWLQDWRANPVTDCRMFISMTGACQAANRTGKPLAAFTTRNVARYPVLPAPRFSIDEREKTRQELGFAPEEVVAIRFGRPDPGKWTDWECRSTARVRQAGGEKLKLLLMEPPEDLQQRIASGEFGQGIVVHKLESSPSRVASLVDACDIVFHAARFGESFGYAIAEGMAAGKPVITRTIPWGDNAPVELVEHGITGFVCCSEEGMGQALRLLVTDVDLRASMGDAGRGRILALSDMPRECSILEAAIRNDSHVLDVRWRETLAFAATFPTREWNVIEKSHPHLFARAPEILRREMIFFRGRNLQKRLSAFRADLRSMVGLTAYK